MRIPVLILTLVIGIPPCLAALEWKATEISLKTAPGQEKAVGVFPFHNGGDRPVRILTVTPDCSCMVAKLEKEEYAPGESGEIRAEFELAGRVGLQTKTITVTSDDPSRASTFLVFNLEIPELVVIKPRFLFWAAGGRSAEKSVEIVAAEPAKTAMGEIQCDSPVFEVQLEPAGQAGSHRLRVRPKDTRKPVDTIIRVNMMVGGRPTVGIIYVSIR